MSDKDNRKIKLEQLLIRQKAKQKVNYGSLFDECLVALGDNVKIYSDEKSKTIYNVFQNEIPFTSYSRIDWGKIHDKAATNINVIIKLMERFNIDLNTRVLILWSYGNFPVLEVELGKVLDAIDDITPVGGDTYIYSPNEFVIEFYHKGEITLGVIKK